MVIDKIALTLAIIGALNWGAIGLFGFAKNIDIDIVYVAGE